MNVKPDLKAMRANIYRIRREKKYKQEYMAARLNISQNAYSKVELGYTDISLERLFELAAIFEIDPMELVIPNIPIKRYTTQEVIDRVKAELIKTYGGLSEDANGKKLSFPYSVLGIINAALADDSGK